MAERAVTVRINTVPGQDQMTPQLQRQQQSAEQLQRALDEARAKASMPPSPAGVGQSAWTQALQQNQGLIPAGRIQQAGQPQQPQQPQQPRQDSSVADLLRGQARNIATQQLLQATQGPLNPLSGAASIAGAFSSIPGTFGMVASAVSLVTSALGAFLGSLRDIRPTLAELTGELQTAAGIRTRVQQTGTATAEDFGTLFASRQRPRSASPFGVFTNLDVTGPAAVSPLTELRRLQESGNRQGQQEWVARQLQQARQDVQRLEGQDLGGAQSDVADLLQNELRDYRQGLSGRSRTQINRDAREQAIARLRTAGVRDEDIPEELRSLDLSAMNPAAIRQLATAATTGRLTNAQARVTTLEAAQQSGILPSLRPGAPDVSQLPQLFQSRQMDVLDIHAQVQQEAVRDERQQAQFSEQMRLWEQIHQELQRIRGAPGVAEPNPPVVG